MSEIDLTKKTPRLTNQVQTKQDSICRSDPISAVSSIIGHILWREGYLRNCVNCDHWRKDGQICAFWNALPPAEVIVKGCEKHTDAVPF